MQSISKSIRWPAVTIFMVVYFCTAGGALAKDAEIPDYMPLHGILKIVTETNPEILEALERYHSVKAERTIATSGYWPKVGTELAAGPEVTEGVQTNDVRENLTAARASLYARQNLWNGGKTTAFVNETDARILAAAYEVANVANRVFLETTETYIQVLKTRKLLEFSEENVLTQGKILEQVKEKTAAGFNRISDLKNSEARLALARGNYVSKQQDLNQAVVQFHRQFGRLVKPEQFVMPKPKYQFPETVEETVDIALRHHPALDVAKYNIQVRKYSYEKAKADYWPTLDLELEARHHDNVNGDAGETDQASAMLKLNYTFFDGGARKGEKGKNYGNLNKEYQRAYVERRNVNQTARLAWNVLQAEKHKRQYLKEHVDLSLQTLDAFKDEYFVGRRTLLDLLNMENEYNAAKNANAESKYAHLAAYYQISQATGLMLHEYDTGLRDHMHLPPKKLYDLKGYEELDRNRDFDSVQDVTDQCDNTVLGTQTEFSGCAEEKVFAVGYQEPTELSPYILPKDGTPEALNLKIDRTKSKQSIHMDIIYFPSDSSELNAESRQMMVPIAEQLNKASADFVIEVIGHTDSTASAEHNRKLSFARALSVYNELIRLGIDKSRLAAYGKGEHEPIASNDTEEGKRKNRRIEFKLRKKTGPAETQTQPDGALVPEASAAAPAQGFAFDPEAYADALAPEAYADALAPEASAAAPAPDSASESEASAVAPAPAEPSPYIVPEEGTPEALNLRIDRTQKAQSIQLDLIQFASDSSALNDDIRIVLKYIAAQLIAADGFKIEVIGHTDNTASTAHNQKLSQARAQSVADELIRLGVPRERLVVSGRGEYDPITPNNTEEGKRKNRRIEFKLHKKTGPVETQPQPDGAPVPDVPAVAPAPPEPSRYIVPEKGTPEALNLRIDRTQKTQSIQVDRIQFASDSSALTDDTRNVLKQISAQLIAADGFKIEVIGHTDDTASALHNLRLSQARAQSVAGELIRLGVPKERLVVSGKGEYQPLAPNSTEEGKRKNRRIEFKLTKK